MVAKLDNKPIAVDLFSGAGGLSEGFRAAGFHIAASVEQHVYATETQMYNHTRWKQYKTRVIMENMRDANRVIAKLHSEGIHSVDAVIGGPPCQGFSRSNMRTRNRDNPNNELFRQFVDVVATLEPTALVMENVGDIALFEKGAVVDEIIAAFRSIGYYVDMAILNAVNYRVPQKRKRAFFIGMRGKMPIVFPDPYITDPAKFITVWEAISDLPKLPNGNTVDEMPYRPDARLTAYQMKMRRNGRTTVKNNLVTKNNDLVIARYYFIPQGGNWSNIPDELMANYADKERCHSWVYHRLLENAPSVVLTNFRKNMLIHPRENRGLSVREAARLQSFSDEFVFLGGIMHQQQLVANAVPPRLAEAVAKSLRGMLGI
jgi:DNA (cytosine-5)-methyltransferase 1